MDNFNLRKSPPLWADRQGREPLPTEVGAAPFFSRLTPVALRARSVSRGKDKTGTSHFAQNRNFLFCLDQMQSHHAHHSLGSAMDRN